MLAACAPVAASAQSGTIVATATVLSRPLSIRDASRTAVPGELRVRVEGCTRGALTVDARTATGSIRTATHLIDGGGHCGLRTIAVQLTAAVPGTLEYLVSLEQTDALQAPSFAQFVVSLRDAGRSALAY